MIARMRFTSDWNTFSKKNPGGEALHYTYVQIHADTYKTHTLTDACMHGQMHTVIYNKYKLIFDKCIHHRYWKSR